MSAIIDEDWLTRKILMISSLAIDQIQDPSLGNLSYHNDIAITL